MLLRTICLILVVLLCSPVRSQSQKPYSFKTILKIRAVNKTFVNKSRSDTTRRTYLGKITNRNHRTAYYVITEFRKFAAAATWHGHNIIYFFNANFKLVASVDVSLPESLPVRLKNNILYFPDNSNAGKFHRVEITQPLPEYICIRPNDCEEVMPAHQ